MAHCHNLPNCFQEQFYHSVYIQRPMRTHPSIVYFSKIIGRVRIGRTDGCYLCGRLSFKPYRMKKLIYAMAVFAAVNGTWLSGVYLTEQQIEDYNSGLATADQLAAQLLSATILKKVNEEKAAKISREVDNLQKQKQQLVADVTALEKKQNEIIGIYNSNKEIYDKIHKEYADYQKLVKSMIMAYDYRVHPLPGVFQALIDSEGIPERSEYDERSYFTGHRWNNGNPYIQIHTIPDHTTYISITKEDYQKIENNQTTMWEFVNRKYAPVAVKNSTDLEQQFGLMHCP